MEGSKTFWLVNSAYSDVREFHFSSDSLSFVVYFRGEKPLFVLDNTCDIVSPNNLLIIEALPEEAGEKNPKTKWNSILKNKYSIDPIKIRPKENTKYKKLDISYSDLSLYAKFVNEQTSELLDSIMEKRELLSLDNAYERESENLLNYNKSTQTIEKAGVTLENLKKKILHLSKRLKRQNELESSNPDKVDEVLKAELVQKMYDNTEKLKRTERRIKRAKKRSASAYEDLALNRAQIQEIKNRISSRKKDSFVDDKRILSRFDYSNSISSDVQNNKKDLKNQDVENRKIEELTIEKFNAKNETGEKLGTTLPMKETIMVKETENKNVKQTTEFKPPFVDDTLQDNQKDSGVKFAKKTEILDDKYKRVWMYVASIMVSLIIVFGLFFFLSGDSEEVYVDNSNYIEQNYQEPTVEPQEPVEEVVFEEEAVSEPVEEVVEAPAPVVEEPVSKPVETPKPAPKKVAPKPVVKPAPKKVAPAPKPVVEEEVVVEDEDLANVPEEDDEEYIDEEDVVIEEEDDDDDETEDDSEVVNVSSLQITKKEYVDNVLAGDQYIKLISYLKANFFTLEDDKKIAELEKMNHYWNDFRNATYDAYYESDNTLKSDIDYEEYANDEYLLRLFTNVYYDFYEYVINEFVMKYEYANNTATALYSAIENELDVLGRPLAKLEILARVYNAIQAQGGAVAVLSAIAEKDEAETIVADNMEIEASLIPLTATTEIVYQENLYSDDDVDIVNQDSTEVITDFTKEYAESDDIVTIPSTDEEVVVDDEEDDSEVAISEEDVSSDDEDEEEVAVEDNDSDEEFAEVEDVEEDSEEDEEVATESPADLEVVMEDDSEEISSIEPTEDEELMVSEEDDNSDYYEEDSDEDVEYTDSEEEV
ncbi:MAG: hypothetical protein K6F04_01205, partial [bacterium]|nr:hypothetical protein [bacterium]